MEPELKAFIESIGLDAENIDANVLATIKANFAGNSPSKKSPPRSTDVFATARAENERLAKIAEICAEFVALNPSQLDQIEIMGHAAETSKMSAADFELELSRATRPQRTTIMHTSGRNTKVTNKILEAAICQQGRLPSLEKQFDDQTLQAAHDQFGRDGISLRYLFLQAARQNGYQGDAMDVTIDIQRHAFGMVNHGRQIQASGFSTLNIASILSNTANKFLQEGWMGQDMAWSQIAKRRSVRDFKTVTSYKLSGSFTYAKVGPGGELTHGTVSEDTYTNKADTYGRMFAISRSDIINDDLNAITQIPTELGMGANDAFNQIFWTEFLDNSSFFASGNANVSTVTGTLDLIGMGEAEVIFMAQTKPNGTPLGLMPSILLVPTTLRNKALTLMNSAQLIDGSSTAAQGSTNIYQGRYSVVSSPYMENTAYTGYSAGAWYLLANPQRLATIEAAFLNGRESPTVETAEADFNVLGVQMRAYHDFGVNLQEYRAGVRADGTGP
jgi:phage major head subunit gpT-like protein